MEYHFVEIDGHKCLDPGPLYDACLANRVPYSFWGRANSVTWSVGWEPDTAWLIVSRATAEALSTTLVHSIKWTWREEGKAKDLVVEFKDWVLMAATLIGLDGDENAPYLLELRDKRELIKNSATISADYNVSLGWTIAGTRLRKSSTLNAGTAYTWQELLAALWASLSATYAGTTPTIPNVLTSHSPDDFRFDGVTAWDAIKMLLQFSQTEIYPTSTGFALFSWQGSDSQLTADKKKVGHRLIQDAKHLGYLQTNGRVYRDFVIQPEYIRVKMYQRNLEPDEIIYSSVDSNNGVGVNPFPGYIVDVWTDLIYEGSGTNDAERTNAAGQVATRVFARLLGSSTDQSYGGLHIDPTGAAVRPFSLGSALHQIKVRDYGDGDGLNTEIRTLRKLRELPSAIDKLPIQPAWILKGKPDANITVGGSATFSVWKNGADTGINVTAHQNWIGTATIVSGTECIIHFFRDENTGAGRWVVIDAGCP